MDYLINGYLAFMADENDSKVRDYFKASDYHLDAISLVGI